MKAVFCLGPSGLVRLSSSAIQGFAFLKNWLCSMTLVLARAEFWAWSREEWTFSPLYLAHLRAALCPTMSKDAKGKESSCSDEAFPAFNMRWMVPEMVERSGYMTSAGTTLSVGTRNKCTRLQICGDLFRCYGGLLVAVFGIMAHSGTRRARCGADSPVTLGIVPVRGRIRFCRTASMISTSCVPA